MRIEEFHYKISWRARGSLPGHHRSLATGDAIEFRGHAPLLSYPDPRRLDLRASLRDPLEQLQVRVYRQRTSIPVYALADLSASMGYVGHARKLDVLADFTASLGYSTYRTGDSFGFVGGDAQVRRDLLQPLCRTKGAGAAVARRLRDFEPTGSSSTGLLAAASMIIGGPALVFLVSDFHFPLDLLRRLLDALARHRVVPVVLLDSAENEDLPAFGIVRVLDMETRRERTLLLRPRLRESLRATFRRHYDELHSLLLSYGTKPLLVRDRFDADAVTRYFYA